MVKRKLTTQDLVEAPEVTADDLLMLELEGFPEPRPLGAPPPLRPWPVGKLLPPALEDLGLSFADRLAIDPAPVMASLLAAATAPLAGRLWIAPDAGNPTWTEPAALWVAVVMPVSAKKTPILKLALEPLWGIERGLLEEYTARKDEYDAALARWAREKEGPRPKPPTPERLLANDLTKEALAKLLAANPGLLAYHDELSGLFQTWRREDRAAERAFYLSTFSATPIAIDRITREGDYAHRPALSLLGFIQPGPFRRVVLEAQGEGEGADGLLQRFLIITAEEREWVETRPTVKREYLDAYQKLIRGLWARYRNKSVTLTFTPEAQEVWWDWESRVEREIRNPDLTDLWRAYLGKRLGLTARLAGILAALWGEAPISATTLERAIAFVLWAEPHAARVWRRAVQGADPHRLLRLAEKLRKAEVGSFTPRDLYRNGIAGISSPREAREAVETLLEAGWIIPEGRGYRVNPRVLKGGAG